MPLGRGGVGSRLLLVAMSLATAALASACGSGGALFKKEYEYEEELYLALDGSATLNVNASVAALVALRGAMLPVEPRARVDREQVRAWFAGPDVTVARVSLSRRRGRRFVHVRVDADDVRALQRRAPFAWSSYHLDRQGDVVEFRQVVGPSSGAVPAVGWTGRERVVFRVHVPSRIEFHNAPSRTVERGNILEWEQPLRERIAGAPVDLRVQMQAQSILSHTLALFGSTIVAAAAMFAVVIWWVARRGRGPAVVESRP